MVKIYGLVCPFTGEIRYIGKTEDSLHRRMNNHLAEARKFCVSHKQRWLRKCLKIGLIPYIWLLEEVAENACWKERECAWIARAKEFGLDLTNQTMGGEGVVMSDAKTVARWKKNLSIAMARARQSDVFKLNKSAGSKRAWAENRPLFMAAFNKPETKAKQSARAKRSWSDPASRELMKNRWTPEARAKQVLALSDRREKMKAAMTPEVRAKQAATLKATWAKRKAAK